MQPDTHLHIKANSRKRKGKKGEKKKNNNNGTEVFSSGVIYQLNLYATSMSPKPFFSLRKS